MRSTTSGETFTTAARRKQILRCAVEALAELGYAKASLAEIARRADVSKSVVSYYFAGKDDLLGHVLMDVYSRAGTAIGERIAGADDPVAVIRRYVEANLEFLGQHPADVRAIVEVAANARRPDGGLRFAPQGEDPVLGHLVQLLLDGQTSGRLGDFDTRALAAIIRGAIDTASGRLVTDPAFDLDAYQRELVRLVELAVQPREEPT